MPPECVYSYTFRLGVLRNTAIVALSTRSKAKAVAMVMLAEGPSFWTAPSGQWRRDFTYRRKFSRGLPLAVTDRDWIAWFVLQLKTANEDPTTIWLWRQGWAGVAVKWYMQGHTHIQWLYLAVVACGLVDRGHRSFDFCHHSRQTIGLILFASSEK
jgi:hypothetical protein